jgi:hypothetical protein
VHPCNGEEVAAAAAANSSSSRVSGEEMAGEADSDTNTNEIFTIAIDTASLNSSDIVIATSAEARIDLTQVGEEAESDVGYKKLAGDFSWTTRAGYIAIQRLDYVYAGHLELKCLADVMQSKLLVDRGDGTTRELYGGQDYEDTVLFRFTEGALGNDRGGHFNRVILKAIGVDTMKAKTAKTGACTCFIMCFHVFFICSC